MKPDKLVKALLSLAAVELIVLALHSIVLQPPVFAQSDTRYGYLQSEEGDATASGGKRFVDMRNGNSWICDWKRCILEGRFPLEQVEVKTH
jgi:hypothetical protein